MPNWKELLLKSIQVKETTLDLNQIAGSYDLFTGTSQKVLVTELILTCPNADAGGALTSIAVVTDDATAQNFISNLLGVVANLTAEAQLACNSPIIVHVGKKIRLIINGGATGVPYVVTITVRYTPVVPGGSLELPP